MKNLTLDKLRDSLDELKVSSLKKDDALRVKLSSDYRFDDVVVAFSVDGDCVRADARSIFFIASIKEPEKALGFAEEWNGENASSRVTIDENGDFQLNGTFDVNAETEKEDVTLFLDGFVNDASCFFKKARETFQEIPF